MIIEERIADELAEQGFSILPEFLSLAEVEELLDVFEVHREHQRFREAGVGMQDEYQLNKDIRRDRIKWIEPEQALEPTKRFLAKVGDIRKLLNHTLYLGIKDFEAHFAIYPPGGFYKRHLDQFRHNDHRRISFVCYMNIGWEKGDGGELRLYLKNENGDETNFDVEPVAGKLVLFRSDVIEHEVLPAKKERYSITGWMLDQPKELTFL